MDAFFSPPIFNVQAIMASEVERVVAAFRRTERWVSGRTLIERLDPAHNNGIRAQLTAIERACRAGRIHAEERRISPSSCELVVCYRLT